MSSFKYLCGFAMRSFLHLLKLCLVDDLDGRALVMAALGPVPQVVQPLEMEQEVPRRRNIHELQLSLLLACLDWLVAGSSQDIVLLLLVEVNRDDDVLLLVVKLHPHKGFQRHSPLQVFVCSLGAALVGEASIHVHHPHE